jgi:hypothetical protein
VNDFMANWLCDFAGLVRLVLLDLVVDFSVGLSIAIVIYVGAALS